MYRLMIKQHNDTGLKYLCITKRDNYVKYPGSGKYWCRHLNKHGYNIDTQVLYESDDYNKFQEQCIKYSDLYDVVNSKDWANIVPESGYEKNFPNFWSIVDDEIKADIIKRRNVSIKENHWSKTDSAEHIKSKISDSQREVWEKLSADEQLSRMDNVRSFQPDEVGDDTRIKLSNSLKKYNKNRPISHNRNISKGRMNMLEAHKLKRKEKIRNVYATGKHDALFDRYSKERVGGNNPNAKKITIDGIEYGSISEVMRTLNMSRNRINKLRKRNENCIT